MNRNLEYVQFQGIGTMSRIIQHWTRDLDSHSAVLDREVDGFKRLIEQWPHGGGLKSWMDFNDFSGHTEGTTFQIWSLEVSSKYYDIVMDKYRESARAKKPYDWAGIRDFGFHGDGDPDKTFCSEEMITHLADIMGWDRIKPVTISPGQFRNILQAAGAKPTIKGEV